MRFINTRKVEDIGKQIQQINRYKSSCVKQSHLKKIYFEITLHETLQFNIMNEHYY